MIGISIDLSPGSGQDVSAPPEPAAPSTLTVQIAESSLSFGATATMIVNVDGHPPPDLVRKWTLDGEDAPGQTGASFEGVQVGALRAVVVSATNDSGTIGPVTSDPVTVAPLAPGAFSAGQWAVDATGDSGEVAVTLFGLPPANGAAVTGVERQVDDGAWTALAGIEFDTPYAITGLTDDQLYSFRLRAVNSVGEGPESDTKMEAPFAPSIPEMVGDNGWTFQPVPSSDDLELVVLTELTDETALALEIDDDAKPEATFADMATGPAVIDDVSISGTPALDATMTAVRGRYLSSTALTGTPALQWTRNGSNISGATGETYVLVSADSFTALGLRETATDDAGSRASTAENVMVPSFGETFTHDVTLQTGQWREIDLFEIAGDGVFALTAGSLPAGMEFMADVGLIHGAPTEAGEFELTFTATGNRPSVTTVTLTVERTYDAVQGGAIRRLTGLGISGLTPAQATFATKFTLPIGHASDVSLMRGGAATNSHHIRVIGSNGRIRFEVWDTAGTLLGTLNSTPSGTSYFDGVEHELVIAVDLAGPTVSGWVDGVAIGWSAAISAGNGVLQTEPTAYSVAADTNGTSNPIPSGGSIRWAYVEWGAARSGLAVTGDFVDGPENAGSPQLLFGGSLDDWQNGVNHGSTDDWATQHGTWVLVSSDVDATPLAHDAAVGFGRFATGGRGKPVYRVTSLSASAAVSGSLPWALAQAAGTTGGYILPVVEGALELSSFLRTDTANVTYDGRRQPGLGLMIQGGALWVNKSNTIIQGARCYTGSNVITGQGPGQRDAFTVAPTSESEAISDIYVRRNDFVGGIDESVSCYAWLAGSSIENVTFEGNLIAEPPHENLHLDETVGIDPHGKGPLIGHSAGASSNITFVGNAIISVDNRAPRIDGTDGVEFANNVIFNWGSQAVEVTASSNADFLSNCWLVGVRPGSATTASNRRIQATTDPDHQAVYEPAGSFLGSWEDGVFDGATLRDEWRHDGGSTSYMNPGALANAALFTPKSGVEATLITAENAFLTLADRVGSLNVDGDRHPTAARIVNYTTEDFPLTTGWHGTPFTDNMPPDELRAEGASVAVPGAGQITVTLPAAPAGYAWASVSVTVLDAYNALVEDSDTSIDLNGNDWDDGVTLDGDLAGGAVAFSGLPEGIYTVRAVWITASGAAMKLYMGRPVAVASGGVPNLFNVAVGALLNANALDMGDAGWTNNASVSVAGLTPEGVYVDPQRITITADAQFFRGRFTSVGSMTSATTYKVAALVEAATGGRATLRIETAGGTLRAEVYCTDLATPSVDGSSGPIADAAVEDAGGGKVRIRFDYTPAATETCNIKVGPAGGAIGNAVDAFGAGAANVA